MTTLPPTTAPSSTPIIDDVRADGLYALVLLPGAWRVLRRSDERALHAALSGASHEQAA